MDVRSSFEIVAGVRVREWFFDICVHYANKVKHVHMETMVMDTFLSTEFTQIGLIYQIFPTFKRLVNDADWLVTKDKRGFISLNY